MHDFLLVVDNDDDLMVVENRDDGSAMEMDDGNLISLRFSLCKLPLWRFMERMVDVLRA